MLSRCPVDREKLRRVVLDVVAGRKADSIPVAAKERMPLVLLAERENEAGKSGLFLFEKCMVKMRFFMSNFSI